MLLTAGIWAVPAGIAAVADDQSSTGKYQPPAHGEMWGLLGVEWSYSGDIIVTDMQGRFCDGFRCAHGRGRLGTDGGWDYAGTFRYGDIVGEGKLSRDDEDGGDYEGLLGSSAFPGGPAPLCGKPNGPDASSGSWPFEVPSDGEQAPCLRAWVRRVDRGEVLPLEEAQRIGQWYEKVRSAQRALFTAPARRKFDKVLLAGTDMRAYLAARGWKPLPGAQVSIQRYLRSDAGQPDMLQFIFHGFETPYAENPRLPVSEILPMQLGTEAGAAAVEDPWVAVGLAISIDPSGYVLAFR